VGKIIFSAAQASCQWRLSFAVNYALKGPTSPTEEMRERF